METDLSPHPAAVRASNHDTSPSASVVSAPSVTETIKSQSPSTPIPATEGSTVLKKYSCVLCSQRKVKCDKIDPCSACSRAQAECIFRAPPPPRRRRRRPHDSSLGSNLEQHIRPQKSFEHANVEIDIALLGTKENDLGDFTANAIPKALPHRFNSANETNEQKETEKSTDMESARLIFGYKGSRYIGNSLWASISDEFRTPSEMIQGLTLGSAAKIPTKVDSYSVSSDGSDLIFATHASNTSLRAYHPMPVHMLRLWQTFLDNVDPLVKVFHVPTMEKRILDASNSLDNLTRSMEATLFAIYCLAVSSMTEEECQSDFGEAKSLLLSRYQWAAQQGLINCKIMVAMDLESLQAFVLFLISVHHCYDINSLWILTGIAIRIGQRTGLHRDGASMELAPFEVEMRRRLWWQILLLDSRTAEISGTGSSVSANTWDTKLPLNINDSDLYSEMTEPPTERTGPTEMIFCLLRYEVGEFLRYSNSTSAFGGSWHKLNNNVLSVSAKDRVIDELESDLETRFLRYCDPLIPLHFMASIMARSAICKMRLVAHHPRHYLIRGVHLPQSEKDMLFSISLKIIEYTNLLQSTQSMKRYIWHVQFHFQWHAFAYLLSELRTRTTGDEAEKGWRAVSEVFEHHPELILDMDKALYIAIGNLALKAWEAREMERRNNH